MPKNITILLLLIIFTSVSCSSNEDEVEQILEPGTVAEKVLDNFQFIEGPVWHPDNYLLFSDIPANIIYRYNPGESQAEIFRNPSGGANGNTLDINGNLISAEHFTRRVSRTDIEGNITTIVDSYNGQRLNSPNDLAVRSDGSIYFTDPPYGISQDQEELGFYGVYRIDPDGSLNLLDNSFIRPNGIVLSPDETKLYVNDSQEKFIRVYDVSTDGSISNGRLFADLSSSTLSGTTDGMKVDTLGNVYTTGPGGVWVFSPEGSRIEFVQVPENTTNLAWGDEDYKTLYVTASSSLYKIETNVRGIRP